MASVATATADAEAALSNPNGRMGQDPMRERESEQGKGTGKKRGNRLQRHWTRGGFPSLCFDSVLYFWRFPKGFDGGDYLRKFDFEPQSMYT